MKNLSLLYIFWTCPIREEAQRIVKGLLEKHLIACASLFPVESHYHWKGKLEQAEEVKVLLKTRPALFEEICSYIRSHSSYDVPEISSFELEKIFEPYAKWVLEETTQK